MGVLKNDLLTLMAVASLTIAAITVKADVVTPELGHDTTINGTTTHYGAPVFAPDTTSGGRWIPFPARSVPDATHIEDRYVRSLEELQNKLRALETPTTSQENGLVIGHGVLSLNHDGKAYAGLTIHRYIERDTDQQVQNNLVALQDEYRKNIKSGKWHKFVNGE
jgi:hypothetical protein